MSDINLSVGLKFDGGKPRMELLPWDAVEQVAWVLTYGAEKYGPRNWQLVEGGAERYVGSALRHLSAHARGELLDPESGLPHVGHAASCCLFLLHLLGEQIPKTYDLREVRRAFETQRAAAVERAEVGLSARKCDFNNCSELVTKREDAEHRGEPYSYCPRHGGIA